MVAPIPVLDLFAGPGGLSEGFSAFQDGEKKHPFRVMLSIEKDFTAHETLELRAFFRQFNDSEVPFEYYSYLRKEITKSELFDKYPENAITAKAQSWLAELGSEKFPKEIVDEKIKTALAGSKTWVLIGGPPCQAYSIVGRSRMKNDKKIDFENDKRHLLYKQYLRIVATHQPPIFIMENVPGILSSKINGENTFTKILKDLKNPKSVFPDEFKSSSQNSLLEYRIYSLVKSVRDESELHPKDYIIECEKFSIPQKRHRIILLGIRSNLPCFSVPALEEKQGLTTVREVIGDLPKIRSGISKEKDSWSVWVKAIKDIINSEWFNKDNIDPLIKFEISSAIQKLQTEMGRGSDFISGNINGLLYEPDWFYDLKLAGICNHQSRRHMKSDLQRYFFAACYSQLFGKSPKLENFPDHLLPNHKNVRLGVDGEMFADRFRVQLGDKPATTITSHISKDGHYFIHPDSRQCRSLTVREAARLQTFPDNYFFEGNQTMQYHQVGNAVPPLLARQIANVVYQILFS